MKKIIYILACLIGISGCKKEAFDYSLYEPQASDIDSVYFSTGSSTLIADGKATLQFVLETFRTVQVTGDDGQQKDTLMFVDYTALPDAEIKIYADGQLLPSMEFATTEIDRGSITFQAQIGAVTSDEKTVQLRQPQVTVPKRIVDVVFHVFDLHAADNAYDPLTYQPIEQRHLEEAIEYANAVFNNVYGKDPNGGTANIEFRLATHNPAGTALALPGSNRITYDSNWKASPTANFTYANFTTRINSTAAYQWDGNRFLNIYILPFAPNSGLGSNMAAYQIVPEGEIPLEGIANIVNSPEDVPTDDFYVTHGLGIHRTIFFPGTDRKIEIASYLGNYYGLYRLAVTNPDATDYVEDTRKYLSGANQSINHFNNLLKTGVDGEKFLANNAMDDLRYASLRNCFTRGQIDRMHLVMDWSPVRQAWTKE